MNRSHAEFTSHEAYTDAPDEHLIEGFDPEVALDLGIPIDDESVSRHRASGERAAWAGQRSEREIQLLIDAAEHAAVSEAEGIVTCANCNKPGCNGCGS